MDLVAAELLERLPDAVSIVGPDGARLHTNTAGTAILADLPERHEWNAVDADGRPLPHDQLPVEITRLTGRECSDVEIGLPDADGAVRWLRISTRRVDDVPPPCTSTQISTPASLAARPHSRKDRPI